MILKFIQLHYKKQEGELNMKRLKTGIKKGFVIVSSGVYSVMLYGNQCFASSGTNPVMNGISQLKILFTSIIAGIGVIILAKNIMEAAQAYQQQDTPSFHSGIKGCISGFIMAAIGSVLTFLGF